MFAARTPDRESDVARLTALLPTGERQRALGLARAADRARFVSARILVRGLLAASRPVSPWEIRIERDPGGKPFVPGGPHFSLSHSGPWVLAATAETEVGVDVEVGESAGEVGGILETAFAREMAERIRGLPERRQREQFFRYWTIQEAVLKASGLGLPGLGRLQRECGDWDHGGRTTLIRFAGRRWQVSSLDLQTEDTGAAVAYALDGPGEGSADSKSLRFTNTDVLEFCSAAWYPRGSR